MNEPRRKNGSSGLMLSAKAITWLRMTVKTVPKVLGQKKNVLDTTEYVNADTATFSMWLSRRPGWVDRNLQHVARRNILACIGSSYEKFWEEDNY